MFLDFNLMIFGTLGKMSKDERSDLWKSVGVYILKVEDTYKTNKTVRIDVAIPFDVNYDLEKQDIRFSWNNGGYNLHNMMSNLNIIVTGVSDLTSSSLVERIKESYNINPKKITTEKDLYVTGSIFIHLDFKHIYLIKNYLNWKEYDDMKGLEL